jgi:hypothetical protein
MTVFATWIVADGRFAFDLTSGQHKLTNAEHIALLKAESTGCTIEPDSTTGWPIVTPKVQPSAEQQVKSRYDDQLLAINLACEKQITNGFWSSALGSPFFYGSQLEDQLNLTGVILAGLDSPYACRDEQGVKAFWVHTAAQLRQVGDDFTLIKLQLLQKANTLKQQLDQALVSNDLAAIEAVTWEPAP